MCIPLPLIIISHIPSTFSLALPRFLGLFHFLSAGSIFVFPWALVSPSVKWEV